MDQVIKLLYIAKNIQNLFIKEKNKVGKDSLEKYLEQEERILENMEYGDLFDAEEYLKQILGEAEIFTALSIIKHENIEPYFLRTLRKIKEQKEVFDVQEVSSFKKSEIYSIFENPYIQSVQNKLEVRRDYEEKVRENYLKKQPNQKDKFEIVFKASTLDQQKNSSFLTKKDWESYFEENEENLKTKIEEDLRILIAEILKEENPYFYELLKSFLEVTPESIKFKLGSFCKKIIKEEKKETLINILEDFGLNLTEVKEEKSETISVFLDDRQDFTYEDFLRYDKIYQTLMANSRILWILLKEIIESKRKQKSYEKLKEQYESCLQKEEIILDGLEDLEKFQSYIKEIYGEYEMLMPTFLLDIALRNIQKNYLNEENLTEIYLRQRQIRAILCHEQKEKDYEEDGELMVSEYLDLEFMEKFMKLTARKTLNLISEEEYKLELEKFGIIYEEELEECEKEYFIKFTNQINETFTEKIKTLLPTFQEEEKNILSFLLYTNYFVSNSKQLLEDDFEITETLEPEVDIESPFYKRVVEELKTILIEEIEELQEVEDELYSLVLETYIESLTGLIETEGIEPLLNLLWESEEMSLKRKRPLA